MSNAGPTFVENHKDYVDTYRIFGRHREKQQQVWVEKDLVKKLRDAFIQNDTTTASEFKILAVGSNNGAFDKLLINALYSHGKELVHGKHVKYTVVEPNAVAIDEFKRMVSSQGGVFQNIKFNWVNKRMEEFLEAKDPECYDFIHFSHVLYYVEDEEEILKSAYAKLLSRPGCILAVVGTEGNIWKQVIGSFKTKIPSLVESQHTNAELSEICSGSGWEYETFEGRMDLEVTEVFNQGDPVGQAILKFLLQTNEMPERELGKEIMSEIMELFTWMSWEKKIDGTKRLFVNEDNGVLLIYKRC